MSSWRYKGRTICFKCDELVTWPGQGCPKRLEIEEQRNKWSDIPADILTLITERLLLDDVIRLAAVCNSWHQAIRAQRCRQISLPWRVVHFDGAVSCKLRVSDFWNSRIYTLDKFNETLFNDNSPFVYDGRSNLYDSKDGWLLLSKKNFWSQRLITFVLYHPFRNEVINFYPLELEIDEYVNIARLTTNHSAHRPPNFDIIVFCESRHRAERAHCNMYTCNLKDGRWSKCKNDAYGCEVRDVAYRNGTFYCVFEESGLVLSIRTFNIALKEWAKMELPPSVALKYGSGIYLVIFGGDLLLVHFFREVDDLDEIYQLYGDLSEHFQYGFHVYQYDQPRSRWTRIQSLGNRVLILAKYSSSVVVPAMGEAEQFANMILLHRGSQQESYINKGNGIWIHLGSSTLLINPPGLLA